MVVLTHDPILPVHPSAVSPVALPPTLRPATSSGGASLPSSWGQQSLEPIPMRSVPASRPQILIDRGGGDGKSPTSSFPSIPAQHAQGLAPSDRTVMGHDLPLAVWSPWPSTEQNMDVWRKMMGGVGEFGRISRLVNGSRPNVPDVTVRMGQSSMFKTSIGGF